MAFIQCDFFSEALEMCMSMNVILPQATQNQIGLEGKVASGQAHPVLYLLHGLSDDHTIWMRRTSIERYASTAGLAVIMPNVHRSFYADMKSGGNYWTFVSEELPAICRSFFPLSTRREDTFVAGLSMGGYGAFKLALSHPERFAAAASLSGCLDLALEVRNPETWFRSHFDLVFGPGTYIDNTEDDLMNLLGKVPKQTRAGLSLYQCCGTKDFLYGHNVRFRDRAMEFGWDLTYEEDPGADHEWGYWDRQIEKVIAWIGKKR